MKRRTRYFFISLGIVFFLIAAPLIVFYVGGIDYDSENDRYVRTGILAIKTAPDEATITLDGQVTETTPANLRFLEPKEYEILLTKDGYYDWSKRLEVKAGKATIASGRLDRIYLLKKNSPQLLSNNVLDYQQTGERLILLTPAGISVVTGEDYERQQRIALPVSFTQITLSANGQYLLLSSSNRRGWLRLSDQLFADLTTLTGPSDKLVPANNGNVYGLRQNALVEINPVTKRLTPVLPAVSSFTLLNDDLYYISPESHAGQLLVKGLTDEGPGQTLIRDIPTSLIDKQLLVTETKDVLLFSGAELYRVNEKLEKVSDNIQQLYFDAQTPTLTFASSNELYWYEFATNQRHLIIRNAQSLHYPQLALNRGYAFYVRNNAIEALELDDRSRQNNYLLTSEAADIKKMTWDVSRRAIVFLKNNQLQILKLE
jgi:hypothetical protein